MKTTDRRNFLQLSLTGLAGVAAVPLLGSLAGCQTAPSGQPSGPTNARAPALTSEKLTERITLIGGAPGNVIALSSGDGMLLVDSGSTALAHAVRASLGGAKVHTLFNTHYHADQTGGNALFAEAGATIHAHAITREWLATDYYVPAEDRWVKGAARGGRAHRDLSATG